MRNMYFAALVGVTILVGIIVYAKPASFFASKESPSGVELVARPEKTQLIGTQWVWLHTEVPGDGMISTPEREKYILTFDTTGHLQSMTDCNTIIGKYEQKGNVLSLGPLSSTKRACPDSLDAVYAKELELVNSYEIVGTRVYLNLNRDTGRMVFEVK